MSALEIVAVAYAVVIIGTAVLCLCVKGGSDTCWDNGEHISHNEYQRRGGK